MIQYGLFIVYASYFFDIIDLPECFEQLLQFGAVIDVDFHCSFEDAVFTRYIDSTWMNTPNLSIPFNSIVSTNDCTRCVFQVAE